MNHGRSDFHLGFLRFARLAQCSQYRRIMGWLKSIISRREAHFKVTRTIVPGTCVFPPVNRRVLFVKTFQGTKRAAHVSHEHETLVRTGRKLPENKDRAVPVLCFFGDRAAGAARRETRSSLSRAN